MVHQLRRAPEACLDAVRIERSALSAVSSLERQASRLEACLPQACAASRATWASEPALYLIHPPVPPSPFPLQSHLSCYPPSQASPRYAKLCSVRVPCAPYDKTTRPDSSPPEWYWGCGPSRACWIVTNNFFSVEHPQIRVCIQER